MRFVWTAIVISLGLLFSGFLDLDQNNPRVVFLDVGQGDSIYIRTPSGQDILIDAGYGDWVINQLSAQLPRGDQAIEMIIATHPDADHIGGFNSVLDHYQVQRAFYNGTKGDSQVAKSFYAAIEKENLELETLKRGDRIQGEDFYLDVIWPDPKLAKSQESNDLALAFYLVIGQQKFVFSSDVPQEIEQILLDQHTYLGADIFSVGHHGSKNSSSKNYLEALAAKISVISVGQNNRYGHPEEEVLDQLRNLNLEIKRTDQEGSTVFEVNQ